MPDDITSPCQILKTVFSDVHILKTGFPDVHILKTGFPNVYILKTGFPNVYILKTLIPTEDHIHDLWPPCRQAYAPTTRPRVKSSYLLS